MSAPAPETTPHRYPFRLVERSGPADNGRVAIVLATSDGTLTRTGEWPVTLVAEALAQSILLLSPPPGGVQPRLVGLNRVRLLQPVGPGTRLEVEVEEIAAFAPLRRYACRAHAGGALAATAEITVSG